MPVQNLTDTNHIQRINYYREMIRNLQIVRDFFNKVIFTGEATFTTPGMYNKRNKHYWVTENLRKIQSVKIQDCRSFMFYVACANMTFRPIISEGGRYLNFPQIEM